MVSKTQTMTSHFSKNKSVELLKKSKKKVHTYLLCYDRDETSTGCIQEMD